MAAHDLYHGWFYHNGALRLASSLGWGLQMLKEDTRRLGLREASDSVEAAWANVRASRCALRTGSIRRCCKRGLPAYVLNWFDHDHPSHYWSEMDVSQSLLQIPCLHFTSPDGSILISKAASMDSWH